VERQHLAGARPLLARCRRSSIGLTQPANSTIMLIYQRNQLPEKSSRIVNRAGLLYERLKEIFLLLDDGDRRLLARYNLSLPRFYALFHLGEKPGLSVSELSDLMFCDKSNITRLIKGMEAEELVCKRPHESDGRALRLFLTPQGAAIRDEAVEAHKAQNTRRFDNCLNSVEQELLFKHLTLLKQNLQYDLEQNFPLEGR